MLIEHEKTYTLRCDVCSTVWDRRGAEPRLQPDELTGTAVRDGWVATMYGHHICPPCCDGADDEDAEAITLLTSPPEPEVERC